MSEDTDDYSAVPTLMADDSGATEDAPTVEAVPETKKAPTKRKTTAKKRTRTATKKRTATARKKADAEPVAEATAGSVNVSDETEDRKEDDALGAVSSEGYIETAPQVQEAPVGTRPSDGGMEDGPSEGHPEGDMLVMDEEIPSVQSDEDDGLLVLDEDPVGFFGDKEDDGLMVLDDNRVTEAQMDDGPMFSLEEDQDGDGDDGTYEDGDGTQSFVQEDTGASDPVEYAPIIRKINDDDGTYEDVPLDDEDPEYDDEDDGDEEGSDDDDNGYADDQEDDDPDLGEDQDDDDQEDEGERIGPAEGQNDGKSDDNAPDFNENTEDSVDSADESDENTDNTDEIPPMTPVIPVGPPKEDKRPSEPPRRKGFFERRREKKARKKAEKQRRRDEKLAEKQRIRDEKKARKDAKRNRKKDPNGVGAEVSDPKAKGGVSARIKQRDADIKRERAEKEQSRRDAKAEKKRRREQAKADKIKEREERRQGRRNRKDDSYNPDAISERLRRWYLWRFKGYVKLRTLSRMRNGEYKMETTLIKHSELPREAVACTGERGFYCHDTIGNSEWYLATHMPTRGRLEDQFTASDACLYMLTNKIDNALAVNWTDMNHVDFTKIILIVGAVLIVALIVVTRL